MLYRKKTLTEAAQWFADGHAKPWARSAVREMGDHFEIDTREGTLRGEPGDWIARGPQGEVYPIGAEIFAQTYEPADQASAARPATAEDVRLMILKEIRAALREDHKAGSHSGKLINPNGDNLHEIPPAVAARFQAEFEAHARTLGDMRRSWQAPSVADGSHQPAAPRDYSEAVANARLNERDVRAGEYAFNRIA